jgi:hypothetical protein
MRPSGEFIVPEDPEAIDTEGVVQFVMPSGMGLMWEGEPTSPGSGPGNPSQEAVSAEIVGGENTSDETGADPKPDEAGADPKEGADPKTDEAGGEKGDQTPPAKTKESTDPLDAMKAELEESEKERLAKDLPEEYDSEGVSLGQMKRDVILYQASIAKAKEQIVSGPTFQEDDSLPGGELDEAEYKKIRQQELVALGMARATPAGATTNPDMPTHANYNGKK